MRRAAVVLALLALLGGCGLGAGGEVGHVTIVVTSDFGTRPVPGSPATGEAPGGATAMRMLQRTFPKVQTRYGGGFVQSIAGLSGGHDGGRPVDWFFYVNGIEAPKGAASTDLHRGDVVWWDRHDWGTAQRVPAVVGSYPEPFLHGEDGKRFPTRVECANGFDAECNAIQKQLGDVGVIAGETDLASRNGGDLLRVLVGPWPAIKGDFAVHLIGQGPGASGVFAKPSADGRSIAVYDPRGRVVRTLGPGTGLIAATAAHGQPPVWVVTGTDRAGIELAARSFSEDALRGKFAVAIRDDLPIPLPQVTP